jgi:Stage II sporulation protein E (SpoIIE)
MPRFRDWVDLGRDTFHSLGREDVTELYSREWQGAKEKLTAEHRAEIDQARTKLKRFLRATNAVLFGLVKRLAPARRLVVAAALFCFLLSLIGPFEVSRTTSSGAHVSHVTIDFGGPFLQIGFILLLLLLAMELVDKINFRDELILARELQASLIPKSLPQVPGYELAAFNRIANMVGGDIYDFLPLADGRLAVLFGDASGHGMAAGLVMAVAHAGFRTQLEIDPEPAAIFASLNRLLCRTGGSRSFFAAAYVLVAPDGSFRATLAGHPPLLVVTARGEVRVRVGQGAYPLGIRSSMTWNTETAELAPGELLFLHSDGLTEARDRSGREFGEARIEEALRWSAARPAGELVSALSSEVLSFCGRQAPEDDISIGAIRRIRAS